MAGGHGSTPAAWTAVVIVIIGFLTGAVGMILGPNWLIFGIGAALVPVGAIVGRLLSAMGLGESHPPRI
jgi:hypothetical protein